VLVGLTVLVLAAGCAGSVSPTPASQAPTIGQPADDGARIIAVESPKVLVHRSWVGSVMTTDPNPVPVTRVRDLTIDSPGVGTVKVRLLLPSGFDAQPSTRWPVLYLLDGGPSLYSDWSELFDVEALTAPTNLLVVMPDAGVDKGWYSDWWNGGKGGPPKWETFHLVELRQLLERNWHAGDKRAIAGYSMGGYGAIEYAARQPGTFAFAGSYSGVLDPINGTAAFPFLVGDLWGDPRAQADVWKAHDPLVNAAALKGTALYVAYGNGQPGPFDNGKPSQFDPAGTGEHEIGMESAAFVKRLAELGIPVTVDAYGNGTHNFPYMQRDLDQSFPLILKALGE
jgi:S-formylglutathione hydrolase FrmB